MTTFGVQVVAGGNTRAVRGEFEKLTAQVDILNASLVRTGTAGIDGFQAMQRAATNNSANFRAAAASSGMWESELVKIRSATDQYTEALSRQQISFKNFLKNRSLAKAAYKDQLRLQEMVARRLPVAGPNGKQMFDVMVPTAVNKNLDTFGRRIGWAREQLRSFSTQAVNWGKNMQWAGRQLMVGFTLPVVAFGAAAGVAAYQIDKELTRIQKVYDTTAQVVGNDNRGMAAQEKELAQVRVDSLNTARYAAEQYGSSATDTLNVQAELAATGLQGAALQKSTAEVMRISTLGELDRADAIKATIALQSTFKMSNKELTDSFNYMNAVENATSLQLKDFTQAIPIAAGPVKAFGGDIYELGVLMTAMKERGIDAAQGANALKATMQRLSRPSKQIQQEFSELTNGVDITKLVDDSNGLIDVFTKIGNVTRGLDDDAKRKIFAGLFGGWQVTRMTAIVEGMQDVQKGVGQAGKAYQLAQQDAESWGAQADTEIKRIQQSISGQFMIAINSAKIELSEMGEPFVQTATTIIKGVTAIIKAFNGLPHVTKMLVAIPLVVLAIAGPLLMITGLIGNFAGNIGKAAAMLMGLFGRMELLNKESALAKMAATDADHAYQSEAKSVQMLTAELRQLVIAQNEANSRTVLPAGHQLASTTSPVPYGPAVASNQATIAGMAAATQTAGGAYRGTNGQFVSQRVAEQQAMNRLGQEYMVMNNQIAVNATEQERAMQRTVAAQQINARTTAAVNSNMGGAALAGGAMAASMVLMSTNSGEVGHNIGQFLLLGSIAVPAMKMLVGATASTAKSMWSAAAAQVAMTRASAVNAAGTVALAGRWASVGAIIRGVGTGIAGLMGPVGWVTAGIAAVGFGAYKLWQHQKAITAEEVAHAKAIKNSVSAYEDLLNVHQQDQKVVSNAQTFAGQGKYSTTGLAAEMKKTDEGKALVSAYGDSNDDEKNVMAMRLYLDTLNAVGGTAKKAQRAVEALYIAGGKSSLEANLDASHLIGTMGDTEDAYNRAYGATLYNAMNHSVEAMDETASEMADVFSDGLYRADKQGAGAVEKVMNRYQNILMTSWNLMWDRLDDLNKQRLAEMGIKSGKDMRQFMLDRQNLDDGIFEAKWNIDPGQAGMVYQQFMTLTSGIREQATKAQQEEGVIVEKLAQQLGIQKDIHTMEELRNSSEYKRMTVTKKNAEQLYAQLVTEAELSDKNKDLTDADRLRYRNVVRQLLGLEQTNSLTSDWVDHTKDAGNSIDDNVGKVGRVNSALWTTSQIMDKITGKDVGSMFKDAMQGIQQDMADGVSRNFDNQMNAAIAATEAAGQRTMDNFQNNSDRQQKQLENRQSAASDAMQKRQEAATNAMQRRQENATAALERRQEARRKDIEDSYNRRIKAIQGAIDAEQKAEEIRKRIFDAEMTRLDRMNTEQNRNIDFNVALNSGDLDEAARIRNDMQSQESQWNLEDAQKSGERGSERRVKHLEERQNQIETARDKELEAIQKVEDAEKKSLQRRQEAQQRMLQKRQEREQAAMERSQEREKNALDHSLERQQKALEASVQANNDAEKQKWDDRKNYLDKSLEDFVNMVATNEKDLRKHIKTWKSEHHDLAQYTTGEFNTTSDHINHKIETSVRGAMRQMANDIQWENNGSKIAKGMIQGAFGLNMRQFKRWMLTGKYPENAGKGGKISKDSNATVAEHMMETRHEGGEIGTGGGSRKGVARTNPLHPNETLVRAQRGEFMVNKHAAADHGPLLNAINSGKYKTGNNSDVEPGKRNKRRTGGAGLGFSGVMAGLLAAGVKTAIGNAVTVGATEGAMKQAARAMSGIFGASKSGTFGGRSYGQEQLRNAATIANVGAGMHMSKRDIEIGIMTAITESGLINIHGGDRDSQGLFQQRPSMGWGTVAQVTDPEYAARKFFSVLKGVAGRDQMAPWVAAQSVQRSAFSDGSNYLPYWDDAKGIFGSFTHSGGSAGAGYVPGSGGKHRPVRGGSQTQGIHDTYTGFPAVDIGVPVGTKLYAVADGKITRSEDLVGNDGRVSNGGYYSYGRVIQQSVPGGEVLYAHLSRRSVRAGQTVKGGSVIGATGNTGHSFGPHLHFGARPMSPYAFLKSGGTVKQDGTPAILHRNETVLTEPLSEHLKSAIGNLNKLDTLQEMDRLAASQIKTQEAIGEIKKMTKNSPARGHGESFGLRTGSFNVFRKSANAKSQGDLKRLMHLTDVLSLTEMIGRKRGLVGWIKKQGWGYTGNKGHANDTGVAFNRAKFDLLDSGFKMLNPNNNVKGWGRNRGASYALLKNKDTGRRFWQIAAHTAGHAQRGANGPWKKIMMEQYQSLNLLMKRLRGTGYPVIMSGDFNNNTRKSGIGFGFKGMHDIAGAPGLDRMFASKGLRQTADIRKIRGLHSDHPALINHLKIPGLSVGGFTLNEGIARLHANETVLTAPLSQQLMRGIERLDTGVNSTYNVNVYAAPGMDERVLTQKVITAIDRRSERLPNGRRR